MIKLLVKLVAWLIFGPTVLSLYPSLASYRRRLNRIASRAEQAESALKELQEQVRQAMVDGDRTRAYALLDEQPGREKELSKARAVLSRMLNDMYRLQQMYNPLLQFLGLPRLFDDSRVR